MQTGGKVAHDPVQPLRTGHFDMQAYTDYFAGKLSDKSYEERELAMALAGLPSVPA